MPALSSSLTQGGSIKKMLEFLRIVDLSDVKKIMMILRTAGICIVDEQLFAS
jgi:hypothetical protein